MKTLLILMAALATSTLQAQPVLRWQFTGGPYELARTSGIDIVRGPGGELVTGFWGLGYRSDDGARTWRIITDAAYYFARSMAIDGAGRILVAQRSGWRRSTDGGVTFDSIGGPEVEQVVAMARHPDGDIVASLVRGDLIRTSDCGTTWRAISSRAGGRIAVDASGLMLVTRPHGVLVCRPAAMPFSVTVDSINESFGAIDFRYGVAVASEYDAGVFLSLDSGVKWRSIGLAGQHVTALAVADDSVIVAATWPAYNVTGMWRSQDRGRTWDSVPRFWSTGPIRFLRTFERGEVFGGSYDDTLVVSRDGGRSWQPAGLMAAIAQGIRSNVRGELLTGWQHPHYAPPESSDTVRAWRQLAPPGRWGGNEINGDGVIIAGGCRTTDRGTTWQQISDLPPGALLYASPQGLFFAGGDTSIARSADGLSWHNVVIGSYRFGMSPDVRSMGFAPWEQLYAAGETGVWRSSDFGLSWSEIAGLEIGYVGGLAFVPPSTILVGARNQIFRSRDRGASFSPMPLPLPPAPGGYANYYRVAVAGCGVLAIGNEILYRTTDFGRTWTREDVGIPGRGAIDIAVDNGVLYLATDAGVFVARDTAIIMIEDTSTGDVARELEPRGSRIISATDGPRLVVGRPGSFVLALFDARGAEVLRRRRHGPASLPLGPLPGGMYLLRVVYADGRVDVHRVCGNSGTEGVR